MIKLRKRQTMPGRYSGGNIEFQKGSRNRVLKNKLGIVSVRRMNDQEITEYAAAAKTLTEHFTTKTSFTEADIRFIHKTIFG
jgi:hypothetical protein